MTTEPRTHQPHRVYFAQYWEDEWVLQDHVFCDGFTIVAGPDVGEATLRFNYGHVQPESELLFGQRGPKEVNGWYVKVEVDQAADEDDETGPRFFRGKIVETTNDRRGRVTSQGVAVESGAQTFHCRGVEFLLQRTIVDTSWVVDATGAEIQIGRAIAFNLGAGRETQRH